MKFWICFIYLFVCGVSSFLLGRLIPHRWIREDQFPFRLHTFEKDGSFYDRIGIRSWQNKMPDMSKLFPQIIPKKMLEGNSADKILLMIKETCIAELIHQLLGIASLYCLVIWEGTGGIVVTLLFVVGNLPYILIQRYNRPRLIRLYQMICIREQQDRAENCAADRC